MRGGGLLPAEEAVDLVVIAQEGKRHHIPLDHVDDPKRQAHPQLVRASANMLNPKPNWGVAGLEIVPEVSEG